MSSTLISSKKMQLYDSFSDRPSKISPLPHQSSCILWNGPLETGPQLCRTCPYAQALPPLNKLVKMIIPITKFGDCSDKN